MNQVVIAHYKESLKWVPELLAHVSPNVEWIIYEKDTYVRRRWRPLTKIMPVERLLRARDQEFNKPYLDMLKTHFGANFKRRNRVNDGREGETYLHHLITTLASASRKPVERVMFLQGNPTEHLSAEAAGDWAKRIVEALTTTGEFNPCGIYLVNDRKGNPWYPGLNWDEDWERIGSLAQRYGLWFTEEPEISDQEVTSFIQGAQFCVDLRRLRKTPPAFWAGVRELLLESPIHGHRLERLWRYLVSVRHNSESATD
jgi:hypothetical protein